MKPLSSLVRAFAGHRKDGGGLRLLSGVCQAHAGERWDRIVHRKICESDAEDESDLAVPICCYSDGEFPCRMQLIKLGRDAKAVHKDLPRFSRIGRGSVSRRFIRLAPENKHRLRKRNGG